ncbi:putative damage-inducible protein DinB [Planomicrobium soli]|uniref:Putative damage-inducible protein DinB n=1 Tax=Planomicrobium soli TaxID=1176648 RepID=A0A2P8H599_9BACL|nr:DinB family protein [Planomicrobium soli]PSL41383.1 putative damage-inducible protein DinB [Planomicrobium soli]
MQTFFRYNWKIREEWYTWCENVSEEELLSQRTGGMESILKTFFHIVDVEWSWIRLLKGKEDFQEDFEQFNSLDKVKALDAKFRPEVEAYVDAWEPAMDRRPLVLPQEDGSVELLAAGEVMRHVIAHQIHHIGQLSVWSRELGLKPVSPNLIGHSLIKPER